MSAKSLPHTSPHQAIERDTTKQTTGVQNKSLRSRRKQIPLAPYLFIVPGLLLLIVWIYWPLLQTFWNSFYRGSLTKGIDTFVGFQNYLIVASLPEFQRALLNTGLYIIGLIPLTIFLPMSLAFLISRVRGPLQIFYRSIFFMPVIMAPVVASSIWLWLLDPTNGIVNHVLMSLGSERIYWLNQSSTAMWVIILITAWKTFGFSLLLFIAAIMGIDQEHIEAARLDGASEFGIMRFIIFPQITSTFSFLLIYTILYAGQWVFGPVNVLTQGGPNHSTTSVFYILYDFGFSYFNIGYASAAAVLIFGLLAVGTFVVMRYMERRTYYES